MGLPGAFIHLIQKYKRERFIGIFPIIEETAPLSMDLLMIVCDYEVYLNSRRKMDLKNKKMK